LEISSSEIDQCLIARAIRGLHCEDVRRQIRVQIIDERFQRQFGIAWTCNDGACGLIKRSNDAPKELGIVRRIAARLPSIAPMMQALQ
jgi:hypothetical protein